MSSISAWTGSRGNILEQSTGAEQPNLQTGSAERAVAMGGTTVAFGVGGFDSMTAKAGAPILTFISGGSSPVSVLSYNSTDGDDFCAGQVVWAWGTSTPTNSWLDAQWSRTSGSWINSIKGIGSHDGLTEASGSGVVMAFRGADSSSSFQVNNTGSAGAYTNLNLDNFRLGANAYTLSSRLSGSITEVMILSRSIQDVEVEGYKRHVLDKYLDPTKIPNLTHRWRADSGIELVAGDIEVANWTDSVSKATALGLFTEPDLVRFIDGFANNRTFLTASATNSRMNVIASSVSASVSEDFTFFVVAEHIETATTVEVFFDLYETDHGNSPHDQLRFAFSGNGKLNLSMKQTGSGVTTYATAMDLGTPTGETKLATCAVSYQNTGTASFVLNGQQETLTGTPQQPTIRPFDNIRLMGRIGANQPCYKTFEFMVFDRALSFAELQNLTAYSRLYYGFE